jgi:hypothetical protein
VAYRIKSNLRGGMPVIVSTAIGALDELLSLHERGHCDVTIENVGGRSVNPVGLRKTACKEQQRLRSKGKGADRDAHPGHG